MHKNSLLLAICLLALVGCVSPPPQATNQARREALAQYRQLFVANQASVLNGVYYLLSIDDDFKSISMDPKSGDIKAEFSGTKRFKQALAVAIDRSGYLLTAKHVLSPYNYVIGNFGIGFTVKRVRVVYQSSASEKCDYAIVKVDAALPFPFEISGMPKAGDVVFAVVFDKNDQTVGGDRLFTAGQIKKVESLPEGTLIDSTVPLRPGDSGGPMLSPDGRLIGITQGWNYTSKGGLGKYTILSVRPSEDRIARMIKADVQKNEEPFHAP